MIGVIADDLTGAAEIGAVGWRHGLRAEIVLAGDPSGDADLICVDTDSRSCAPCEAAERAARAARLLRQQGAGWVYKKADSVLRGNVTPELEAVVSELGLNGALLVPANPSLGRTVAGGQYFLGGQLIHETEFARDPKHPRLSSDVRELVAAPTSLPLVIRRAEEGLPVRGMVIGEAAGSDDLRTWAARKNHRWLMAGGAEFFNALLAHERAGGRSQATSECAGRPLPRQGGEGPDEISPNSSSRFAPRNRSVGQAFQLAGSPDFPVRCFPRATGKSPAPADKNVRPPGAGETSSQPARELFVCGSASEVTRNFVTRQAGLGVPVFSLPRELTLGGSFDAGGLQALADQIAASLQTAPRVILHVGLPPVKDVALAESLALRLVAVAKEVLLRVQVRQVFAEGGATAVALARQMGWQRLQVTAELAPGVVTLALEGERFPLFTMKPGSYPWPEGVAELRSR